ncbi:MAG: PepSY-associated TM helix domain-containing protein [Planctomycetota bacterium]|nr:PepSY-associated TM helix domain-containing protein [Planctomycetota bacterium]
MKASKWTRKLHRVGAVIIALPLIVVILSGLLLNFKKQSDWIQPPTQSGVRAELKLPWSEVLAAVRAVPESGVQSWDDIDRVDARPGNGVLKVRCQSGWEVQLDGTTGAVLWSQERRSDWIEALHDGSWFHPVVKWSVFLPASLLLGVLWATGLYLWWLPRRVRRKRRSAARG